MSLWWRLALFLVLASFVSFNQCAVPSVQHDAPEATRKQSKKFEFEPFRGVPIDPILGFNVTDNTPGNSRFKRAIGRDHALEVLRNAAYFAQEMLGPDGLGRGFAYVKLTIENFGGNQTVAAISTGTQIRLNSMYIENFTGDVKYEFNGIVFHENAKMWLQARQGLAPRWILTGIMDFVRLEGGWPSQRWPKRGSGSRWTNGYAITAFFLEYCSRNKKYFVRELNSMMKRGYSNHYFAQLLGKDVHELWDDYKSLYGTKTAPALSPQQGH
ncbi:hypothetical protein MLD38_023241 [Melastoma candidum]|uniref:Uncharacterized protein n=1 Tax=Melastoma candidum TaxID=119954 RepID=A0ACB9QLW9_9MYRT|nr:hypothetical protein MLD38_023241 [Melastoma candidum]